MSKTDRIINEIPSTNEVGVADIGWLRNGDEIFRVAITCTGDWKSGKSVFLPLVWNIEELGRLSGLLTGETSISMEDEDNQLIGRAMDMGLPMAVAVHLVMNRSLSWDQLVEEYGLNKAEVTTAVVGAYGPAGIGKSTWTVDKARETGWPVVDVTAFDEPSAADYLKTSGEIFEVYLQKWKDKPRECRDLAEYLDNLAKLFEDGKRPEVVLLDLSGLPREGENWPAHIFALFTASCVAKIDLQLGETAVGAAIDDARRREAVFRQTVGYT